MRVNKSNTTLFIIMTAPSLPKESVNFRIGNSHCKQNAMRKMHKNDLK